MHACLNCADETNNHAVCNKCFAAAERNDGSFMARQKGKATYCPRCGYTEVDKVLHGDHWRCDLAARGKRWPQRLRLRRAAQDALRLRVSPIPGREGEVMTDDERVAAATDEQIATGQGSKHPNWPARLIARIDTETDARKDADAEVDDLRSALCRATTKRNAEKARADDYVGRHERVVLRLIDADVRIAELEVENTSLHQRLTSDVAERDQRIAVLEREHMPHMCRMDHQEIRHRDSEHEQCPFCRILDAADSLAKIVVGVMKGRRFPTRYAESSVEALKTARSEVSDE